MPPARRKPLTTVFAAALSSLVPLAACVSGDAGGGPATAFEGARLIAGDGGAPVDDAVLVVREGRIVAAGPRGEVAVPEGAARVDLTGKTVMPALVNAHMHLPSTREERTDHLLHNAYYGATAVVSLGLDSGDVALRMRDERIPGGARALSAGAGITRPEPGRSEVPYWIDDEEGARAAVRELAAQDVDLVKIWVDDRGGRYEKLTPELYGAVIDEAHRHDLQVAAHIFALDDAKGLLRAGVDAFAHGVRDQDVDDEFVAMMRERPEVVYIPNLPDPGAARDLGWLSGTVPAGELGEMQARAVERPGAREGFDIQARNLVRLRDAGVRIAFGTDGGSPWAVHQEMEDMVRAGMTPAEVLVAATRTSADFLGLSDVGTLEPGRSADFLVLDADPLADITNTRRIAAVYLQGTQVDRDGLSARLVGGAAR